MKLPSKARLRDALGFDALVYKDKGTVFVTNIEAGETHAVSLLHDIEYLNPEFGDVADVIADRMILQVQADLASYALTGWSNIPPDCQFCGI